MIESSAKPILNKAVEAGIIGIKEKEAILRAFSSPENNGKATIRVQRLFHETRTKLGMEVDQFFEALY